MNLMSAPYRRTYQHTKSKGHESNVNCGYCGRIVPKWKTIPIYRGFRITDPVLRKQIDTRFVSGFSRKLYVCPSCARYRGIVKVGRSRKSRPGSNA